MFLLVGAAIGLLAPGGIIFFLFPPLIALIGIGASRFWSRAELVAAILAILFLYLTWGEMLALLEELLNQGPMWLFAPMGSLIILPVLIEAEALIDRVRPRAAALVGGTLALAGWGIAVAVPAYSADRQQRFAIEHITDTSANKTYWAVLNDGAPLPSGFGPRAHWERRKLPYSERLRWLTKAPPMPQIKPPTAEPVGDPITIEKGKPHSRTILLHMNGADSVALIAPEGANIRAAGIDGFVRPFDKSAKEQNFDRLLRAQLRRRSPDDRLRQFRSGRVHARRSPQQSAGQRPAADPRPAEIRPAAICPRMRR